MIPSTVYGVVIRAKIASQWALGVITSKFHYGVPPFHDETPEKVFENILSGHIEWHEDYWEISPEAKDFMQRLMTLDPTKRLGANGAFEVKARPFFVLGIDWDKVTTTEAAFIPQVSRQTTSTPAGRSCSCFTIASSRRSRSSSRTARMLVRARTSRRLLPQWRFPAKPQRRRQMTTVAPSVSRTRPS